MEPVYEKFEDWLVFETLHLEDLHLPIDTCDAGSKTLTAETRSSTSSQNATLYKSTSVDILVSEEKKLDDESDRVLPTRRFGLTFSNLSVEGHVSYKNQQPTFASPGVLRAVQQVFRPSRDTSCKIIKNFNGLVRSGEMLMVLGQPGSGCSTLLKVLSGELHGLKVANHSQINYGGITFDSSNTVRLAGERLYLAEVDVHFPELTVNETLNFASSTRKGHDLQKDSHGQDSLNRVISAFDLDKARSTLIGDHMIPGISGGEKVRTSLAEAFLSDASLQCWDNCTRGLDSSTALKVMRLLAKTTSETNIAVLASVYQASEAICDVFDKVTLLHEGQQIFFGTFEAAKKYFESLGFVCPLSMSTAEFLLSVTNLQKRIVLPTYNYTAPRTIEDFVYLWQNSAEYNALSTEIERFDRQSSSVSQRPSSSNHSITVGQQISLCVRRGFLRLKNNLIPPISGVIGQTLVGIILGTVFWCLPQSSSGVLPRDVLLFYSVMINACTSAFEVLTMWAQRPIVEKQTRYAFYLAFTEAIASMICDLPNKLLTTILFNTVLYFMTGLRRTADGFFIYLLFVFTCLLTMSMFFRMIGSMSRTLEQTMAPVAILILNYLIYAGFVIPARYMHPWLGWIRYINPIAYTYESLMINEFWNLDFICDRYIPAGPEYTSVAVTERACALPGSGSMVNGVVKGSIYLETVYDYSYAHMWRNFGILLSMLVVFCMVHLLTTQYVTAAKSRGQVLVWKGKKDQAELQSHLERLPVQESLSIARHDKIFSWSDLSYEIPGQKQSRKILEGIDGWVKPGQLTAVMGTTGAGKTTLLNVLADRIESRNVGGEILMDGKPRDTDFRSNTGYVQQTDIHHPYATVREALVFSALLRQSSIYSKEARLAYVETVLKALRMESFADAIILTPGEGLNTEQRRRLTIALELVARPELLLFLDEPTSGLDSETAWSVCTLLRKLANNGQSVLCTIHQPSASLFSMFDQLLLLGAEGRTLYFGPVREVVNYFESQGAPACRANGNPAEWILDITNNVHEKETSSSWANLWRDSEERSRMKSTMQSFNTSTNIVSTSSNLGGPSELHTTPFLTQVSLVTGRKFREYWRSPGYLYSKLFLCAGAALFNGFSFYNTPNTLQGLQNALFSIFLLTVIFSNVDQQVMPRFIESRSIFEAREQASRTYSWPAFLCAEIIVEAVWQTLVAVLIFVVWYYPTGMWRNATTMLDERAALVFLLIWTFCLFCSTFSHAVAAAIEHAETAVNIAQLLFYLCLIFCGVVVQGAALPRFWTFMYRVSPLTYLIAGMATAGLSGVSIQCSPEELIRFSAPANLSCQTYMQPYISQFGGSLVDPDSASLGSSCGYCQLSTTDDFLADYGMIYEERWRNLGLQFVYLTVNIGATFALYWLVRVRKSGKS